MNRDYSIRRENMLAALGLPEKIPVGKAGKWVNLKVVTGPFVYDGKPLTPVQTKWKTVTLPNVYLRDRGVACRIKVECPECRKVMRFCGLQQHVGTRTCQRLAAKKNTEVKAKGNRYPATDGY